MQWCAAGYEHSLETLTALLSQTAWPGPPRGFTALTPPRPMRAVFAGSLVGPEGEEAAVLKWSRPAAIADRLSRRVRGGKGPREGRALRALAEAGVRAPRPLAFADDPVDVLVTACLPHLEELPHPDHASAELLRAVAELLAAAHRAGLRHRDLHLGNLGLVGAQAEPALIDLGGARVGAALEGPRRLRALARIRHGVLGGARRSQRFRALVAYMRAVHGPDGAARERAREMASEVESLARVITRRYRRGRDRRATRTGKHFEVFTGPQVARAIRRRRGTSEAWREHATRWLAGEWGDAHPLKSGGGVVRMRVPGEAAPVVLKRYETVAPGRLPRPLRTFRRAYALEVRGIAAPRALLAAARSDGSGVGISEWVDAPSLHTFCGGGRMGALATLAPTARRRLLTRLGRAVRAMHDAEVTHRDLKAPNLLVLVDGEGAAIQFADLEGVRIRQREVSWARRARDLARLDASLDACPVDRVRVLRAYMAVLPRPPVTLRQMAKRIAHHVRRKRGPEGRPK